LRTVAIRSGHSATVTVDLPPEVHPNVRTASTYSSEFTSWSKTQARGAGEGAAYYAHRRPRHSPKHFHDVRARTALPIFPVVSPPASPLGQHESVSLSSRSPLKGQQETWKLSIDTTSMSLPVISSPQSSPTKSSPMRSSPTKRTTNGRVPPPAPPWQMSKSPTSKLSTHRASRAPTPSPKSTLGVDPFRTVSGLSSTHYAQSMVGHKAGTTPASIGSLLGDFGDVVPHGAGKSIFG
jgi:hypothetical protein